MTLIFPFVANKFVDDCGGCCCAGCCCELTVIGDVEGCRFEFSFLVVDDNCCWCSLIATDGARFPERVVGVRGGEADSRIA